MRAVLRLGAVAVIAVAVNVGLYLLVPYIQVLIQRNAVKAHKAPRQVTAAVAVAPPEQERLQKRVMKEIKTETYRPPSMAAARPSTPGGGLKIDLSPAGGDGQGLVSGGDRTGGIGSGSGGGQGSGLAAMTYEPGQTDTDAKPIGADPPLDLPPRAEREGVSGRAELTWIVNEAGLPVEISVLVEDPKGYGFGDKAIQSLRKMRFKPATLQKMAVRQRWKRTFSFHVDP